MLLNPNQLEAVEKLKNGSVLCAEVGTGKSRTALAYFYSKVCGGKISDGSLEAPVAPRDLFIITTAKKRNDREWIHECEKFGLSDDPEKSVCRIKVTVDSWQNIKKYRTVRDGFIIFDEQKISGNGPWSKAFIEITRKNEWILLSATPGDKWIDYLSLFIAHGFVRNRSEFISKFCILKPYVTYMSIVDYHNEEILENFRDSIVVVMDRTKDNEKTKQTVWCDYDRLGYRIIFRDRWDIYEDKPIEEPTKLGYLLRRVVNSDISRLRCIKGIIENHKRVIIFYNYDYELDLMKKSLKGYNVSEWNGHKHEPIPKLDSWIYLVQYNAGAEGWNCITSNCIIFFSLNYSYKIMAQAEGRIDRMNTKYDRLYYYYLRSHAPIDNAIMRALRQKKDFNERAYFKG